MSLSPIVSFHALRVLAQRARASLQPCRLEVMAEDEGGGMQAVVEEAIQSLVEDTEADGETLVRVLWGGGLEYSQVTWEAMEDLKCIDVVPVTV